MLADNWTLPVYKVMCIRVVLVVRSGLIDMLLVTCNPVLPASGSSSGRLKPAPPTFLAREVVRRVVRHPDGSKNKICQRAPVLESQWRPSSNYHSLPCSYPSLGMASGVNLAEKSRVGVPTAVYRCTQPHSGKSCDVAGAKL